jgi:type IV secretion system protein VirD4
MLNWGMDDFISIMTTIATTPPKRVIQGIVDSDDEQAKVFINNFVSEVYDKKSKCMVNIVTCDSKMLLGISQEITNRLSIFATDERIMKVLSPSENQIRLDEPDKYNVFISVPEDRLEQYGGILRMFFTQLMRSLERRQEMHEPGGRKQIPILVCLDEMARIGKIEILAQSVSTLRSKGVTMLLVLQSIAQLDLIYGSMMRRVIMDNMSYYGILRSSDVESQRYFSDLCGTRLVKRTTKGTSYDHDKKVTGYNEQVAETHEALIRPHEFATLKDVVVVTPNGVERLNKQSYYDKPLEKRAKSFWGKVGSFISKATRKTLNCIEEFAQKTVSAINNTVRNALK